MTEADVVMVATALAVVGAIMAAVFHVFRPFGVIGATAVKSAATLCFWMAASWLVVAALW